MNVFCGKMNVFSHLFYVAFVFFSLLLVLYLWFAFSFVLETCTFLYLSFFDTTI